MVLLKLLGYAIGSVLMYWGLMLSIIAPWLLALLFIMLINAVWNRFTGKTDEWQWFINWTESAVQTIHRFNIDRIGWIPGVLIQIWYAGYAADLVNSSSLEKTTIEMIALQIMGSLGVISAAAIFYCLYYWVVEVNLGKWIYILVGVIALVAYGILLQQSQIAMILSESWQKTFFALLSALA